MLTCNCLPSSSASTRNPQASNNSQLWPSSWRLASSRVYLGYVLTATETNGGCAHDPLTVVVAAKRLRDEADADLIRLAVAALGAGRTVAEVAQAASVPQETVYEWQLKA
jgi:inosine-uridine nucleoside N-ribohydrolase